MSAENSSEQDEVIALMAQEGISRVKATKLLYELAKQKKKDAAKIELNINQGDNSTVKNQIERFSSQRDLSNASNQVHRDIDLSEEGRPVLKLDAEASFRYNSSGPHPPVPTEYVAPAHEPYQRQKSMRSSPQRSVPPPQGQQSPGQGQRARAETYGSSEDEAVVPYDEDKPFLDSPLPSRNDRGVAGGGAGYSNDNNNNGYGGWNGVLEEDSPNAASASMPNPAPKRRSSSSALNLRPLSRLHPNKFRDSLSPEDQDNDYDEEDSGSDYDANSSERRQRQQEQEEQDGYRSGDTGSSDGEASALDGDRLDAFGAANLTFSQSASPVPTPTNRGGAGPGKHPTMVPPPGARGGAGGGIASGRTATTTTAAASSSSTSTTTTSTNFTSSNHLPQGQQQSQGQSQFQRRTYERDDSSDSDGSPLPPSQYNNKDGKDSNPNPRTSSPPGYQEQQQRAFPTGANDSWSAGSPSQGGGSSESKSFSQSSANVQQLAVEEKLALLNAGRSSAGTGGLGSPAPLSAPSSSTAGLMGPPSSSATTKVLGSKKLTIRAASAAILATTSTNSASAAQALITEEQQTLQQQQDPHQRLQERDLPPPPPAYEEIAAGTSTPPPMYSPQQQPRRRPSQSGGNNMDMPHVADEPLPDYFSDDGDDGDGLTQEQRTAALMAKYKRRSYMRPDNTPEAFRNLEPVDPAQIEEMLRQEQERKDAAAATIAAGHTPSPFPFSSANGPSTPPHSSEVVYVTEAPTERAVEAVMHKESADLVEELVAQGYSRENAISLAKEIELDRRAGRFGSGGPRSSYGDGSSVGNTAPNSATSHSNFNANEFSPQRPGLPRHGQAGSGASVVSQSSSYNNAHAWGNNSANSAYYSNSNQVSSGFRGGGADDDCGSVISQISGVSRQSAGSFCESDKLLMNLLLSQQKARYGVNMYESLSNSDEPSIERYMSRGLSLDQAVLRVFEKKFGPVDSNQAMPRNLQSMSSKVSTSSSSAAAAVQYDSAEAHEIVSTMHAEIELLMLSGDYSREVAVRMLLNKVARERAQQALGGLSIDSDNHSQQLHRSMSMSGMGSPKGRNGHSSSSVSRGGGYQGQGQGGDQYSEADFRSGGMHSARSMYDVSSSSRGAGGASVVSERSSNRQHQQQDVPMPHHHPGDNHHNQHQNDYIAQYHQQEYNRGPNGGGGGGSVKGGDQYIIHHHYQNAPGGGGSGKDRDRDREHRRRPSASGGSVRTASSGTSRTVDDREYLPTLLQEQEATYGVNMFEYLAPDDPEVSRLMNEFNFSRTDAMIAVFQQFPPVVSSPAPGGMGSSNSRAGGGGSSRSHHHRNLSGGSSAAASSPRRPGSNTNPNSGGSHNSGANGSNFFPPTPSASGPGRSQYDEDAELERVMKLSMQEVAERPGAVSMPGPGSGMSTSSGRSGGSVGGGGGGYGSQYNMHHGSHSGGGGASSQDVAALVGMGFTSAQAHDALARHHNDVHKAANYLLGGA